MRPDTSYAAPIGCIDLAAEGYEIRAYDHCLPWYVEIIRDPDTDFIYAREWHAVECPAFVELLADTKE